MLNMSRKFGYGVPILLIVVLAMVFKFAGTSYAATGINQELSFEGKIATTSTGVNITNGTYNIEFKIYTGCTNNTGTGCTTAWTEDYLDTGTNVGGITFNGGTFQVNLGSICAFSGGSCETYTNTAINWNTYPLYLSIQVGNNSACTVSTTFTTNCSGDGVMSPYILLTATPYSLNSNALGGLTSSSFSQLAATNIYSGQNIFQSATNTAGIFQIQNSVGAPIVYVSTVGNDLLTYPGFESGSFTNDLTGWQSISPGTITQNSNLTDVYNGLYSLDLTTTSSNGGAQTNAFTQTVSAGTYDVSFYVMPTTAMNASAFNITLNDGSAHTCSPASLTLSTSGFRRVDCSVTTTGNLSYLSISQNDSSARTIYIDTVQLQAGSSPLVYSIGSEQFRGTVVSPLVLQAPSNSEDAFTVNNASGTSLFNIDSLDFTLGIGTSATPGALLSVGGTTGNFQVNSSGTVTIAAGQSYTGSGAVTVSSGAATALTITGNAASTWQTTAGSLKLLTSSGNNIILDAANGATANVQIGVGNGGSGSTTPDLLVLDDKSSTGDPTEVNGAMYYNASTNNFRCGVAGTWENCIGGLMASSSPGVTDSNCSTLCAALATGTGLYPANYCVAGRVIQIIASGVYSSTASSPTLSLSLYIGTNTLKASDTVLGATGTAATAGAATAQTNDGWSMDVYLYCVSTTSAWVQGGTAMLTSTAGASFRSQISATTATTITNTTQNIYLFPTWSTASSTNSITCDEFIVRGM
jgi:hypothetical protein